jgi:hypothetical protein
MISAILAARAAEEEVVTTLARLAARAAEEVATISVTLAARASRASHSRPSSAALHLRSRSRPTLVGLLERLLLLLSSHHHQVCLWRVEEG